MTWDLLAGTNQIRNIHAAGPLSIALANDDWTLSFGCDAYTTQQTDDAIAAALTDYFTRAEVTVTVVAAIDESKGYTDTQLADYSNTAQTTQAIADALVPYGTAAQRDAAIAAAWQQPSRPTTPASRRTPPSRRPSLPTIPRPRRTPPSRRRWRGATARPGTAARPSTCSGAAMCCATCRWPGRSPPPSRTWTTPS